MVGKKELKEILSARFKNDKHTKISQIPLPSDLKDTYKAANRIKEAINNNEKIAIIGDYDVDGVVSSVIMNDFLSELGANFIVKIPNRFTDGYGLNPQMLNELDGINLIITVDNGISANDAAEICYKKRIDLIITDHHMPPPTLPKAYAIINPKQNDCTFPNVEICGAQVAWYLIGALKEICNVNYDMSELLDLLIIAIIADMMELRDLNRALLKFGIKKLNNSKRACFKAIREHYFKKKFEFDDISYTIAPLINSTGRMDDASLSYKFLCSKNIKEANYYLDQITKINRSRKEEEHILYKQSLQNVDENDHILVTWGENWHEGVIGIVASRLTKNYKKPAIVFSIDKDANRAKGSARSIGKFDILELIASQKELLEGFGGHKGAAGLVINPQNLSEFKRKINNACFNVNHGNFTFADEILGELNLSELDNEMLKILEFYEPYGQKNPRPLFKLENAIVKNIKIIGKEKNHAKIAIEKNNAIREGLFFNFNFLPQVGDSFSFIASIGKNSFRGEISPELIIKEIL
ncbi:single-stranded-DNA-specific exonuclease RecJ [Campylobacter hominis]